MELRGIEFGNVMGASGVQGYFGEGYDIHKVGKLVGLNFSGMTFVAKTTILKARKGNMELTRHYTPRYPFPRCIRAKPLRGGILSETDVTRYHQAGASSVFLGSVAVLRPWRVQSIIKQANSLDWS